MRIMLCYPWLELGGGPNDVITIAKGLKERGHEVFLFTKSGGIYEERLKDLGITYISAPYDPFLPKLYHLNWKAYRMFCKALDRYSIDIVHSFHTYSYILSLFAAPPRGIPVVFTAIWFVEEWLYPSYPGWLIFVAEEFKDQALHLFMGNPKEVLVIPNRVDLEMFRPGLVYDRFVEKIQLPKKGWKIAFMSRIDSWKINSLRYAVDAAEILNSRGYDVKLVIAGDGPLMEKLRKYVDDVNEKVGIEIVRLIGAIVETPEFLSWADIVLGIGRCAWEGMATGKPTLVVGENGFAGTVEPANFNKLSYHNFAGRNQKTPVSPVLLANEIERIMNDESLYDELSNYARACAIEHYDYKAGVEKMEELYKRALQSPLLSLWQKIGLLITSFVFGYLTRFYTALRIKLRVLLGRGRPEDFRIP
ncbi:MAG: hypothetical protein B6D58_08290 [candidate division Zixibacteria bacterium 4484_95]|nr:MAG: hypothetical protein B6D58_08290 [candidate division Zixibacteria bacterium 4484_95]